MDQQIPTTVSPVTEDRTVAIVSYLSLIGFLVAVILHGSNKTRLGAYHLRQALGIYLTAFVGWIGVVLLMFVLIGAFLVPVLWIGILVMWIMGLISAVNGEQKPVFLLGEKYQEWFKDAFN